MVKVKFTKSTLFNEVQYKIGDIDLISEGDALHLYGIGDAEPYSINLGQEAFGLPRGNLFANVHGKRI